MNKPALAASLALLGLAVPAHITSPGIEMNDVSVPFAVACASKAEAVAAACDQSGSACHAGVQLASPVRAEISKELPPKTWSGGTLVPGTYLLTAAKQYTFEGTTVTDDGKPIQATVVLKKASAGETAELVTTEGACIQRSTIGIAHSPKPVEGMAPDWPATPAVVRRDWAGTSFGATAASS